MGRRPFLLLSVRPEDAAADDEYAAMLRFTGLEPGRLRRIRVERTSIAALDPTEWSGIILGGGPYNVSDPDSAKDLTQLRVESELLDVIADVVEQDHPFLGCCYGIGTIGRYLGATVDRTYAEPISAVPVSLTALGSSDPLFAKLPGTFSAFVGHKEAVTHLPPAATLLASSPGCPVQAFRVGTNVYATQFHPELDVAGICTRIDIYRDYGYFAPDSAHALQAEMRATDVRHPSTLLREFVRRFADGFEEIDLVSN